MGSFSIYIYDKLELELAWFKTSNSYFNNNFPVFLLFGILNTASFKVRDVL